MHHSKDKPSRTQATGRSKTGSHKDKVDGHKVEAITVDHNEVGLETKHNNPLLAEMNNPARSN